MKITSATPAATSATPGLPATAAWQPLRILTFYRVMLAGLLTVFYYMLQDDDPFNVSDQALFSSILLSYLAFGVVAGFTTRLRWPAYQFQALLQVFADIGALALLMHASGGVNSSLAVLLVIAVASGSLVLPGRLAFLFAAVATLTLLFETGLASLSMDSVAAGVGDITRAGLLGLVLFGAAGLAYVLALRARESEALAKQRGIDLADLQQLNQYIIHQLQSGVLAVDPDNRIRLANDTAHTLLGLGSDSGMPLAEAAPELAAQLQHWKQDPQWQAETIPSRTASSELLPHFSPLHTAQGNGALIVLEDSAQLAHQTQQVKLASLGRLTASIAHEIRNPLGAISHAAQLLAESENLNSGDKRLTEIIGNHTQRVNTIIENVLQLSRRSASQPQTLELGNWLEAFRNEFLQTEAIAPEQLTLTVEPPDLQVRVDPGHLHQVLVNLCQNGLRHAGDNPQLTIQAHGVNSGAVQLDIIDNGAGIDAQTAEQMFEPFYTTATSGTGLGLYIAGELCELNQARLSYQRADGAGSCFRIHFPAQQTP
ncbi:MAG TPA: PAS domain-containing protein [Gammaproteobacteria bacterium]|nr:PAS domain-containing protein [Gammaproteobacteria bacterium]